ncbi:oxidoreductase FAD/NAD(P)-binding domain protein [Sulfobacillus acidophilus TPY]|uniref:Phenol 2-monooxygenase P5 subunit n=1 Tax=Sulfobacillus acidophilus (strain ATCC 700253 / DSM 10332 / NAL) TaxID=679936 RepID=G8U0C3_SULAD|nr:oxidoreductase FAD/NAD(P)-binding domain protein [Sulfobacillus acidophilus TPY]AEW06465.1 phenol 2-monooxygenase P5 subunit [Sulfobacillus acidophilus DSM 10332]
MAYRIRIEPLGREISAPQGTNILDACLRQGIWLPHACTHGTCGTCKAQVLEGEIDYGDASSFALMDFEREDGYALLCQAKPLSDVVVEAEVDVEEGVEFPLVEDYRAMVVHVDPVSPLVRRVTLELDRDTVLLPGQYFQWEVPGHQVKRAYSAAQITGRRLEFHIKYSPQGVASEWVFNSLRPGDQVALSGPYGRFFLRPPDGSPAVFLAGGTGLAPIKAMITALYLQRPDYPATLIFGARTVDELYDDKYFRALSTAHPTFRYLPAVSDETPPDNSHVVSGRVDEVIARTFERLQGHKAYVAGPSPMVDACVAALYQKRLFARDIYREDFFTQEEHGQTIRSPLSRRGR